MDLHIYELKVKLLKELSNDKTKLERLYAYTQYLMNSYNIKTVAITCVDIVYQAIDDLLEGKRSWDAKVYPDAYNQVKIIIDNSLIKNVAKKENRISYVELSDDFEESPNVKYWIEKTVSCYKDAINNNENAEIVGLLDKEFKKEETIKEIKNKLVYISLKNELSNKEIAKEYGIKVSEVENQRKQIKRKLQKTYFKYKKQ